MKRASTLMIAAAGAFSFTVSASAHHSFAAEFDRDMPVTVTGHRAKNNPHVGNASTLTLADCKRLFAGSSIENEPAQ